MLARQIQVELGARSDYGRISMPRLNRTDVVDHTRWHRDAARLHGQIAAIVLEDDDPCGLSASAFRRRLERARELASHLYLDPLALPADGTAKRKLISTAAIAEALDRDDERPFYVWQANSPPAIRAILRDLNEPGIAEDGGHAWTVMGDRPHYRRPGAYILAASRRTDAPAHGVLFASRCILVEPNPIEPPGILPILRIELDYVYVRRSMRRRGITLALATAVVDQALTDIWHLVDLMAPRPKRDRRLAIALHADCHTEGGKQFVNEVFGALESHLFAIDDRSVKSFGVIDHVDWL